MPIQSRILELFRKASPGGRVTGETLPEAGGWGRRLLPAPRPRVAPLGPAQAGLVIGHFLLLGRNDRHMRFNGNMSFEALCTRYHNADWGRTRFLGLWVGKRLVGVAELALMELDGAPAREIGISVRGPWQHKGLAQQLFLAALTEVLEKEGVPLVLFTQAGNRAMVGLARHFGGEGVLEDGDYRFVFHTLPEPGAVTRPKDGLTQTEASGRL